MKRLKEKVTEQFVILHLEDLKELRVQMKCDLKAIGVEATILEAEDVKTALEFISSKQVHFIISDWNLPDGTGFDFLKKVRINPKTKDVPFIMCTTISEIAHMIDAINAGANEFITKPWSVEELDEKFSSLYQKFYED